MAERANGILLDTSVVVAHLRGLINLKDLTAPGEPLFLPLVVVGELYKGALKSNHPERNRLKIEEFLRVAEIGGVFRSSVLMQAGTSARKKLCAYIGRWGLSLSQVRRCWISMPPFVPIGQRVSRRMEKALRSLS